MVDRDIDPSFDRRAMTVPLSAAAIRSDSNVDVKAVLSRPPFALRAAKPEAGFLRQGDHAVRRVAARPHESIHGKRPGRDRQRRRVLRHDLGTMGAPIGLLP